MGKDNKAEKYQQIVLLAFFMILAIPAILLYTVDVSPHKLTVEGNMVKVGVNSYSLNDIKDVKIIDELNIDYGITGTRTLRSIRGTYKLEGENQDATVYAYKNKSPYIRIEFKDGLLIYNDKNSNETEKTYKSLDSLTNIER